MTKNNTIKTIFTNVVPTISQGVTYPEKELLSWKNNTKYQLADDGSLFDRIDILIGNDYYYSIMSTDKIQIGQDLYLVKSANDIYVDNLVTGTNSLIRVLQKFKELI